MAGRRGREANEGVLSKIRCDGDDILVVRYISKR